MVRKQATIQQNRNELEIRLGVIEKDIFKIKEFAGTDHKHRIECMEFEVKNLKDLFAFK